MSQSVTPGVVIKQQFTQPGRAVKTEEKEKHKGKKSPKKPGKTFTGFLNYINREEAKRQEQFPLYQNYMGNPEKSNGLFSADSDSLTEGEEAEIKRLFALAQDNGSLMWQTVISFDNSFLEENGLYDPAAGMLDEARMRNITRAAIRKIQQSEGLENAVWTGAIHYNTDNIHIHVAMAEPEPRRRKKTYTYTRKDGTTFEKEEYVGRFRGESIRKAKASVVNDILNDRDVNIELNDFIRGSAKGLKDNGIDPEFAEEFLGIYEQLPKDVSRNLWNYKSKSVPPEVRAKVDMLTDAWLRKHYPDELKDFEERLRRRDRAYAKAYGKKASSRYYDSKMDDLRYRMGNAVFTELRSYDRKLRDAAKAERERDRKEQRERWEREAKEREDRWRRQLSLRRSLFDLEKALRKEYGDWKSQMEYEKALDAAARQDGGYD